MTGSKTKRRVAERTIALEKEWFREEELGSELETNQLRNKFYPWMAELKDPEQEVQLLQGGVADLDQLLLTEKEEAENIWLGNSP